MSVGLLTWAFMVDQAGMSPGEWPGGISPPGPRRTRRAPLGAPGSHCPAIGQQPHPPVGEEPRLTSGDVRQEPPCPRRMAPQPLELPLSPTDQTVVDRPEDRM